MQVIVLWTANTERYSNVMNGLNDTAENLLASIERNETEVAPSSLYAVACIKEGIPFINGAPQNTFVPGLVDYAVQKNVLIAGDDFKSGQTKMKSVLVDFLVGAGIKPTSIVSYNHLGNNDGMNLSAPQTFRSKEISKSNVVDDMVASNSILYKPGEHPDHVVVIKYVPNVGDSKRAMDEYMSEIFMGGHNTISMHNVCEDSLLAAPIILDLVLLAELTSRIQVSFAAQCCCRLHCANLHVVSPLVQLVAQAFSTVPFSACGHYILCIYICCISSACTLLLRCLAAQCQIACVVVQFKEEGKELHGFHPVAVLLSYLAKAPLVPDGTPVVNALAKQRAMLENTFRACAGLYPENNMMLEFK